MWWDQFHLTLEKTTHKMEFNNSIENQVKQETSKSTEKTKKGGKSGSYFNMLWELLPSKNKSKIWYSNFFKNSN